MSRYWLTSASDPDKLPKIRAVCQVYSQAPSLAARGERVISTDEMTGVQALERRHPTLPMRPGQAERREFEYTRHGTLCFIVNFDVVSGQVVAPPCGERRTEEDFLKHVKHTVATDPKATRWHFVVDNLTIPLSESLVRYVAEVSGVTDALGEKDKRGILHNKQSRAAFLSNPSHSLPYTF